MVRVALGASSLSVARLGVGCWAWGDREYWRYEQDYGPREVLETFQAYVAAGLDLFDTAESYGWGKGEQLLGALARRSPRPLVLATKYAPLAGRGGPAAIAKGLASSLKRLAVERIDLYQLHWADRDEVPIDATMAALAETVRSGQVTAVGVSNFRAGEMRQAHAALARHGIPLASNQVRYSLLQRGPETDGVLAACRELGVTLLAYSPLEQGLLSGKYDGANLPSGGRAQAEWFLPANLSAARPVLALLRQLGDSHGVEPAAIALAWLLAKPGVLPLAGARSAGQARSNAAALNLRLSDSELAQLDQLTTAWR